MAAAQQTPDCNGPRGYKDFRRYSELSHRFNLIAGYKSSYGDSTFLQKKCFLCWRKHCMVCAPTLFLNILKLICVSESSILGYCSRTSMEAENRQF